MKVMNAGLMFSGLLVMTSCGGGTDEKQAGPPRAALEADGFVISPQPFDNQVVVTAELQANEQVQLMAPMAGQVLDIYFQEGQRINEGQAIIRMDDRSWKAQLMGLRAELDATSKDLSRKKSLLAMEGSTQEEIDGISSKEETLRSQIKQLELNVELANVVAPFSGNLGLRNFSKGAYMKAGDVITVITQSERLKVDFSLPQEYRNSIKVGKTVQTVVDGDTINATIYAIDPLVDASSRTINIRATLIQNGKGTIMPGTFAVVLVGTDHMDDALLVPTQAIVPEINDQTVFVFHNGKAERKKVILGGRNAQLVQVVSGIAAGDTLLTTGLLQVKTGMDITLKAITK